MPCSWINDHESTDDGWSTISHLTFDHFFYFGVPWYETTFACGNDGLICCLIRSFMDDGSKNMVLFYL